MRRLLTVLAMVAAGLIAQVPEPAPIPAPAPILSPPSARFTISAQGQTAFDGGTLYINAPTNGSVAVAMSSMSAQGSAPITSYAWSVNGMSQACSMSCSATVDMASNSISLTVTDSNGQSSTTSASVNLSFQSGPVARFSMTAQGRYGASGQTLSIPAPASGSVSASLSSAGSDGGSPITTYVWTANGSQLPCAGSTCSFELRNSSTVGLTVTNGLGQSSSATASIQLTQGPGEAPAPPQQRLPQRPPAALTMVMSGGGKSSSQGSLVFDLPRNGRVTVTMRVFNELGFPPSGRFVWTVNGSSVCGDAYTCSYAFELPDNAVSLTLTDFGGRSLSTGGKVQLRFP